MHGVGLGDANVLRRDQVIDARVQPATDQLRRCSAVRLFVTTADAIAGTLEPAQKLDRPGDGAPALLVGLAIQARQRDRVDGGPALPTRSWSAAVETALRAPRRSTAGRPGHPGAALRALRRAALPSPQWSTAQMPVHRLAAQRAPDASRARDRRACRRDRKVQRESTASEIEDEIEKEGGHGGRGGGHGGRAGGPEEPEGTEEEPEGAEGSSRPVAGFMTNSGRNDLSFVRLASSGKYSVVVSAGVPGRGDAHVQAARGGARGGARDRRRGGSARRRRSAGARATACRPRRTRRADRPARNRRARP